MTGVFVSYRREDAGMVAVDIARELESSIEGNVFFDLRSIGAGEQYRLEIADALQKSSVVIVLLGRDWAGEAGGVRRIDDEEDVFRHEIETALASAATVIPVLVGDAPPIDSDEMPASLRPLTERNWHRIRLEAKWAAIQELIGVVHETLELQRWKRIYGDGSPGEMNSYQQLFDPRKKTAEPAAGSGIYSRVSWPEDIAFRVNVALATERMLVVAGPDGSGRDSLAADVANSLGWRYYSFGYGSAPSPGDLLYSMDNTARLADAQVGLHRETSAYVEPGPFWWAFDPGSARRRGTAADVAPPLPLAVDPGLNPNESEDAASGAILELSGDPPENIQDYLRPLYSRQFMVPEIATSVRAQGPLLVVISTEDVRAVEPWVRRRAVVCHLHVPDREKLMDMVRHQTDLPRELVERVIEGFFDIREGSATGTLPDPLCVIDALKAIDKLGIKVDDSSKNWRALLDALDPP